jgi:hypothetical protein
MQLADTVIENSFQPIPLMFDTLMPSNGILSKHPFTHCRNQPLLHSSVRCRNLCHKW